MKKVQHFALACALAIGASTAVAQGESGEGNRNAAGTTSQSQSQSPSAVGQKAKAGLQNLGDKTRSAWNRLKGKAQDANANASARQGDRQGSDTRAMGAGPSRDSEVASGSAPGGAREQRMNDAYENYKSSSPSASPSTPRK